VGSEQNDEPFFLTVDDVFDLTGRGRAVIGPIGSGSIRSGDQIEVVHDDEVVATANATVEMPTGRMIASNSIALVLRDLIGESPRPGDVIRHRHS
jgi:translation elongation factor EF-Tu-like GTPase